MWDCDSLGIWEPDKLTINLKISSMFRSFFITMKIKSKRARSLSYFFGKSAYGSFHCNTKTWSKCYYLQLSITCRNLLLIHILSIFHKPLLCFLPDIFHPSCITIDVQCQYIVVIFCKYHFLFCSLNLFGKVCWSNRNAWSFFHWNSLIKRPHITLLGIWNNERLVWTFLLLILYLNRVKKFI